MTKDHYEKINKKKHIIFHKTFCCNNKQFLYQNEMIEIAIYFDKMMNGENESSNELWE